VSKSKEEFMKSLVSTSKDSHDSTFDTFGQAISFAALLGFIKANRKELGTLSKEIDAIRPEAISNNVIEVLALLDTKQILSLSDDLSDEAAVIFEEYANGGLEIIESLLKTCRFGSLRVNALINELAGEDGENSKNNMITSDDCKY